MPRTCCAIVVTHAPEPEVLGRLLDQLDAQTDVILVDDASPDAAAIRHMAEARPRCVAVLTLPTNIGLAAALNRGLHEVRRRGYARAFLFDQDSALGENFVAKMLAALDRATTLDPRIAAIGPRLVDPRSGRRTPFKVFDRAAGRSDRPFHGTRGLYRTGFLITSGTLLPLHHLDAIGPMREDYFIDNIDLDWCFRAASMGFALVGTDDAVLHHAIGEDDGSSLVRLGLLTQHPPARAYYSSRNRVNLYTQSHVPLGWKLRDLPRFALKTLWLAATSPRRRAYVERIAAGIRDARGLD